MGNHDQCNHEGGKGWHHGELIGGEGALWGQGSLWVALSVGLASESDRSTMPRTIHSMTSSILFRHKADERKRKGQGPKRNKKIPRH